MTIVPYVKKRDEAAIKTWASQLKATPKTDRARATDAVDLASDFMEQAAGGSPTYTPWPAEDLTQLTYLVGREGTEVRGVLMLGESKTRAEVLLVAVAPQVMTDGTKGTGTELIKEALRRVGTKPLEVKPLNQSVLAFYQKLNLRVARNNPNQRVKPTPNLNLPTSPN